MNKIFTGRCLCGAVRYECGPPLIPPCLCHCESCRRASGAHVVAWATVARESFRVVAGSLSSCASSPPVVRQYCGRCGAQITYSHKDSPQTIDITITTLDSPDSMPPADHVWMQDALAWDQPQDGKPQYAGSRPVSSPP
jgi:hypothetical protein